MCLLTDLIGPKLQEHRVKLTRNVPFRVTVNFSTTDRLVQIASCKPENQLHLHSCNNELMNPALLERPERLGSIQMDLRGKGGAVS